MIYKTKVVLQKMGKERILMGTSDLENRTKGNCSSAMDRTVKKQKQEPFILCGIGKNR